MFNGVLTEAPYPSGAVAKCIVNADENVVPYVGIAKVLKMVYIAHGWMLALHERPLIKEKVVAFKKGPGIRELNEEIAVCANFPRLPDRNELKSVLFHHPDINEDSDGGRVIKQVCETYGGLSARELIKITHTVGSPWETTVAMGDIVFDNFVIYKYYVEALKDYGKGVH